MRVSRTTAPEGDREFYASVCRSPAEVQGIVGWIGTSRWSHARIVDLGVGDGSVLRALARTSEDLVAVGVDHSAHLVARCRPDIHGVLADLREGIPLATGCADAVLCLSVVHLVSDVRSLFAEIARVLDRCGRLFLLTCNEHDLRRRFMNRFAPTLLPTDLRRYPSMVQLRSDAAACGLAIVGIQPVSLGCCDVDLEFLRQIRARPWSSFDRLPEDERRDALARLGRFIEAAEAQGKWPRVDLTRTGLKFALRPPLSAARYGRN